MNLGNVIKGGLWIYIGGIFSNILGYLFWIIASKFIPPNIIGSASAILALQSLLIAVFSIGLPTGVKRFIGQSQGQENYKKLSNYFFTTFVLLIMINLPLVVFLICFYFTPSGIFNLNSIELLFVAIFVLLNFWSPLFFSLFNSVLRTQRVALSQTLSAILKLSVGILLLFFNPNIIGIIITFMIASLTTDLVLILSVFKLFKELNIKIGFNFKLSKNIFKSGLPAWIPNMLIVFGQSMGILVVYSKVGSVETGLYFAAFTIALLIYSLPGSIQGLMFPVLSGMEEGWDKATLRVINFSLAVTVPIALILGIYAELPLLLLGSQYIKAAPLLTILVLGAMIYPIYAGYYGYLYAMGRYKHVTILGIIINGSRLILYYIFVSSLSTMGIALSYTLGNVIVIFAMIPSAYKIGYKIDWKDYAKIIIIPSIFAILLYYFNIHWMIGIPTIGLISLFSYTRIGLITKKDLHEIFSAFISEEKLAKLYSYTRSLSKILFGE